MPAMRRMIPRAVKRPVRYAITRVMAAATIVKCEFPSLIPPWSELRNDATHVGELRRLAVRTAWSGIPTRVDALVFWLAGVLWPVNASCRALMLVVKQGSHVRARTGMGRFTQWRESVLLALRLNINPHTYFQYRLFEHKHSPSHFIQNEELYMVQSRELRGSNTDASTTSQKVKFYEACTRLGIPTPQIVAVLRRSAEERWFAGNVGELPPRDLFLKWEDGDQGQGAEMWTYKVDRAKWVRRERQHSHDEMLAYCRARADARGLLIQYRIDNHPDIQQMGVTALSTMRIMTYRDAGAPAQLIRACFKIPRRGSEVDNLHRGGLACGVDLATGQLGIAYGNHPSDGENSHHPDSGAAIAGRVIPHFHEAIALALRAHEQMQVPWSLGWDMAIAPERPMLVEGNAHWAGDLAQMASGEPLPAHFISALHARVASLAKS